MILNTSYFFYQNIAATAENLVPYTRTLNIAKNTQTSFVCAGKIPFKH